MCGIAGILNRDGAPVDIELVHRMTNAIAHRGPDGEGQYVDGAVGLGNRRLAIIDLSPAGAQPMASEDGDGRRDLQRRDLQLPRAARGARAGAGTASASQTDTEVLVHGVRAVGRRPSSSASTACSRSRSGIAASSGCLLARDRYGIKPLYIARIGGAILFASEIKAFLAHRRSAPRSSAPHLLEYFTFQNIFTERHALRRRRAAAGRAHWRTIGADGGERVRALLGLPISASRTTTASRATNTARSSTGCSRAGG